LNDLNEDELGALVLRVGVVPQVDPGVVIAGDDLQPGRREVAPRRLWRDRKANVQAHA
jgi:hypothetical protein